MILINDEEINVTIFPDGTSQVWQQSEEMVQHIRSSSEITIVWEFENEGEVMHVAQCAFFISALNPVAALKLHCPYLPYGRQDKLVSNHTTSALLPFVSMLMTLFKEITTIDIHSRKACDFLDGLEPSYDRPVCNLISLSPLKYIKRAVKISEADTVCYPDTGAGVRYFRMLEDVLPKVVALDKVRDQLTGEVTGMEFLSTKPDLRGRRVMIVDDICDGGRTFIESVNMLHSCDAPPLSIDLYVSHGIFSKGVDILYQSGIRNIFTKKGLVNTFEFNLQKGIL
jgi:ribose-phosphate pyrophosphokinase